MMPAWIAVAAAVAIALLLRLRPYDLVFQPNSPVNFLETDAWFHARVIEHLVANFPHRMRVDPYSLAGSGQNVDTGIFYDWLAALVSTPVTVLHVVAWYPLALGALLPVAVFLLARSLFGSLAGMIAAFVMATLPGHVLTVTSLGYSDHHAMEALLTVLLLWLIVRAQQQPRSVARALLSGLCLAAYLLTFAGGAFMVATVCLWAGYGIARAFASSGKFPAPQVRPLVTMLLIALPFVFWQWTTGLLWMEYTTLAVALAAVGLLLLDRWQRFCAQRPDGRRLFVGAFAIGLAVAGGLAWLATARSNESLLSVLGRMVASNEVSSTVGELQSLTRIKGFFSLEHVWQQYGGAFVLAAIAIYLLIELAARNPLPARDLLLFWSAVTLLMSMSQVRMGYYFAPAVAILSGYAALSILESPGRVQRWVVLASAAALTLIPNLMHATQEVAWPGALTEDWQQAAEWLRKQTPEPFGDPNHYYEPYPYRRDEPLGRLSSYSVMNWWDSGYWIASAGRRVPVSNPTQQHASEAAAFFLATNEQQALAMLNKWQSRYVAFDYRLPFSSDGTIVSGSLLHLFAYRPEARAEDYVLVLEEISGSARLRRLFFRPAYFETMAVRLFLAGGDAMKPLERGGAYAVVRWKKRDDAETMVLTEHRRFDSLSEAQQAEALCRAEGCALVSEDPMRPCASIAPLQQLRPAFASTANGFGLGQQRRAAVQIYERRRID